MICGVDHNFMVEKHAQSHGLRCWNMVCGTQTHGHYTSSGSEMRGIGLRCGAVVSANLWSEMRSTSLCFEILSRLCSEHRPQIHDDEIEPGCAGSACAGPKY